MENIESIEVSQLIQETPVESSETTNLDELKTKELGVSEPVEQEEIAVSEPVELLIRPAFVSRPKPIFEAIEGSQLKLETKIVGSPDPDVNLNNSQ